MQEVKGLLFGLFLLEGLAFVGFSIPLIRGRVPPNGWYGFRVKRTLENPTLWYAINRYAAYHLLGMGVAVLLAAVTLFLMRQIDFIIYAISCTAVMLVGLAITLTRSFLRLRRISQIG